MNRYQNLVVRIATIIPFVLIVLAISSQPSAQATLQQAPTPIIIQNAEFDPANWTITVDIIDTPTTLTEQRFTFGDPDATARFTTDTFPAIEDFGFQSVFTYHLFQETYDPATQGAISLVDYQEDNILSLVTPSHTAPKVYGYIIIVQDGIMYQSSSYWISELSWQTYINTGLQASDFLLSINPVEGVHPDFSTQGTSLQFGYARYRSRTGGDPAGVPTGQELIYEHAVDNWQVSLWLSEDVPNRAPVAEDDNYVLQGFDGIVTGFLPLLENDSDPDYDPLTLTIIEPPLYGGVTWNGVASLANYSRAISLNSFPDSFRYRISDGEFSDEATVTLYIDCSCAVSCVNQVGVANKSTETIDLVLIRRLRDQVMKPTPDGGRYVNMYYRNTLEIVQILMLTNTNLGDEAVSLVELWQSNLYSLVDGDGSAIITQTQVDGVKTFLNNLSAAASSELQQLIADELTRLGLLDDYVGMSMADAKRQAIGDATIYIPLVVR